MNTQSKEVNLNKGIQTDEGWRWSPVVLTAKGHVRADKSVTLGIAEFTI